MYFDRDGNPSENGAFTKINGKLRPRNMRDGDWIGFDLALLDGGSAKGVYLTDAASAPDPQKAIKEARAVWMADKASAYRSARVASSNRSDLDKINDAAPASGLTGRAAVEEARRARLRDKETAYCARED
jgi:hypothetical protein